MNKALKIPEDAGRVVLQAVRAMQERGELEKKTLWRALEKWASDYLAAPREPRGAENAPSTG